MPLGTCVMRIADSVLLTCWPPAPLARNVSTFRSSGLISIDVVVFAEVGHDEDRGERGVAARVRVEGADADQPVHAVLRAQEAVGMRALHGDRGVLDAGLVARLLAHDLGLEAFALAPAEVHAHQHLGPVLGVDAARARGDRDDRVGAIVRAGQHPLELELAQALFSRPSTCPPSSAITEPSPSASAISSNSRESVSSRTHRVVATEGLLDARRAG